ncbi:MAG: YihA family ribosome biogenesis GTP-binding protein, partial [Tissierellia bacterium]|nr:YihA family ribosome biogenesis GTP-binding protein [Tissierellia bacterium]
MKIISSDLHAIAVGPKQYPMDNLPEIAFAGRSNVG